MTGTTLPEPTPERDATTNAFSGVSPPPPVSVRSGSTHCPKRHPLSEPDTYYVTVTGRLQCTRCRMAYVEALRAYHNDPAYREAKAREIADEKARRAREREERRQARRAGRQLVLDARAAAKGQTR